ncbi:MAG: aconitase family protein, partial [Bacillota bacterium]|nr:aconitase family protein [Bacillota bacterium]
VKSLPIDDRFTVSNMAIEAGAKNGIFPVDRITFEYIKNRVARNYIVFTADNDAQYDKRFDISLDSLRPMVACPHLPENTKPVDDVKGVKIDQAVIGSCTNGHISDLRAAAEILKGRKVDPSVRTIIIPATQEIYLQTVREGLAEIFIEAGAVISTPTCGPCLGGHMGILAKGERAVSTTNRNFVGRMGHTESEIYLASPAVAAASAVAGALTAPDKL